MNLKHFNILNTIMFLTCICILPAIAIDNQNELLFYKEHTLQGMASINEALPKNTKLKISVNTELDSATNEIGDEFSATILNDLNVNNANLIPVGSFVIGTIEGITSAGKVSMQATIDISLDKIVLPDGSYIPLTGAKFSANSKYTNVKRQLKGDGDGFARSISVGAFKGATLTFIPGNAAVKSAAVGAAATGAVLSGGWSIGSTATIGGLTGLYYGVKKHGKEVKIASGQELEIVLDNDQDLIPIEVAVDDIMDKGVEIKKETADSAQTLIK